MTALDHPQQQPAPDGQVAWASGGLAVVVVVVVVVLGVVGVGCVEGCVEVAAALGGGRGEKAEGVEGRGWG